MLITIDATVVASFVITIIFMAVIICCAYFLYFVRHERDRLEKALYILMLSIILGGSSLVLVAIWNIVVFR
jgi:hypothetical protein